MRSKEFLKSKNIDYTEIDMAADQDAAQMVIEKTVTSAPRSVRIGNEFIIGFDRKKMETLLKTIPGK